MSILKIYHEHITDLCKQSIPKRIGAYVITHTTDNIHAERYVGSTKNLYNRMCGHCNKEIIYIDLYITDDIEFAESLERVLIDLIEPATNSIIPSLSDKDKEMMKDLLEDDKLKGFILYNTTIKIGYRSLKYDIRTEKDKNPKEKMKSVTIHKDVYNLLSMKQTELIKNKGKHVQLSYVAENAILEGISKVTL